ncbi:MAG: hypothetical protein QXS85_03025 [Acidilobaceae archaeon]
MTKLHELTGRESQEDSEEKRWVSVMMKSAKKYHKLCPYFDKKTVMCLISINIEGRQEKCPREGRFENCPTLVKFLEKAYKYYKERGKSLPRDFQDVVSQAFLI